MEGYIAKQAHQKTMKQLSGKGYGGKRSAINHLIRCHNDVGPSEEYTRKMKTLWRGFGRVSNRKKVQTRKRRCNTEHEDCLQQQDQSREDNDSSESESSDDDDRDEFKEGKEPMSPQLYRSVCMWLLELGSMEGILAACFVCLTWNLACRGNNTARVKFSHMTWTTFDAMQINFKHTKTDQEGKQK